MSFSLCLKLNRKRPLWGWGQGQKLGVSLEVERAHQGASCLGIRVLVCPCAASGSRLFFIPRPSLVYLWFIWDKGMEGEKDFFSCFNRVARQGSTFLPQALVIFGPIPS